MFKKLIVLSVFLCAINLNADKKVAKLVIAGPAASISHPFFHLIKSNALKDVANEIEFKLWRTPSQLKAMMINKSVDFIAVPTNVAANFYNKGEDIQLLNVSIWGLMSIISRDKNIKEIKDLKGKSILVPFRNDLPDIAFRELLNKEGLDVKKDIKIQYTSNLIDAMSLLVKKRNDIALMLEPISSMALIKDKTLYRSIDLQDEWARVFNTEAMIPQAGIVVLGPVKSNKKLIKRFLEEYTKSIAWYKNNPKVAGLLVSKNLPMLNAKAVSDSIAHVRFKNVAIKDAKEKLESFFKLLERNNKKTIGGKIPDDGFYF